MIEPPYTCPLIDSVQAEGDDLQEVVTDWVKSHNRELEIIREANSALREWGQHYEARAEELERQVESLEELLQTRDEEIADLQERVLDLTNELEKSYEH